MKFGICADIKDALILSESGFDFIEVNVQSHLKPLADENLFQAELDKILSSPLPVLAANCLFPREIKVTGPEFNPEKLENYVRTACERASQAGIKTIVFGSGAARNIQENFDRREAMKQLLDFGKMAGKTAGKYKIIIAVEPLNRQECNVFNTVDECGQYVRKINHPNIRLLVDSFHWSKEQKKTKDIEKYPDIISHVHIATYGSRLAPGLEPCDFSDFIQSLRNIGYDGLISVEGHIKNISADASQIIRELKKITKY